MDQKLREQILLTDIFDVRASRGKTVEGLMLNKPALMSWAENEVVAELECMEQSGLAERLHVYPPVFWKATQGGKIERERIYRRTKQRADCLNRIAEYELADLILAIVAAPRVCTNPDHELFDEGILQVHLFERAAEVTASVDRLIEAGYVSELTHSWHAEGRALRLHVPGLREYQTRIAQRLGIGDDSCILDPQPVELVAHNAIALIGLDAKLVDALSARFGEAESCAAGDAFLAATILYGSVLEGVLAGLAEKNPAAANQAPSAPKDRAGKTKPFAEWKFVELISVAVDLEWIPKSVAGHVGELRDSRNLVHVQKQLRDDVKADKVLTRITREVVDAVLEGIRERFGPRPPR